MQIIPLSDFMRVSVVLALFCLSCTAVAQWNPIAAPTKANLKSVHAIDGAVWVSGEQGTVLRSTDNGASFSLCSVPKGAENAVFRSIQGVDADNAVAMASGKGERSALYRTSDGCKTWKQVFVNPEAGSSFDSLRRVTSKQMYLLAEPVGGKFVLYFSQDGGATWFITDDPGLEAAKGETAEGSTLLAQGPFLYFGTTTTSAPIVHYTSTKCADSTNTNCPVSWTKAEVSVGAQPGAGIHALAVQMQIALNGKVKLAIAAVGGSSEDLSVPLAVTSTDATLWTAAAAPPHGDLVAAMIDPATQTLVAVGPKGTDISKDYGKHWTQPEGGGTVGWQALSLPFAVGDGGRIAMLSTQALSQ